jgi:hypothetical protein
VPVVAVGVVSVGAVGAATVVVAVVVAALLLAALSTVAPAAPPANEPTTIAASAPLRSLRIGDAPSVAACRTSISPPYKYKNRVRRT